MSEHVRRWLGVVVAVGIGDADGFIGGRWRDTRAVRGYDAGDSVTRQHISQLRQAFFGWRWCCIRFALEKSCGVCVRSRRWWRASSRWLDLVHLNGCIIDQHASSTAGHQLKRAARSNAGAGRCGAGTRMVFTAMKERHGRHLRTQRRVGVAECECAVFVPPADEEIVV